MALSTSVTTTPFLACKLPQGLSSASSTSTTPTSLFFQGKPSSVAVGRWTCRKEGIHPEFHEDAKVYCNGELVLTTAGTQKEYSVDVWSGNHPFYLGNRSGLLIDADQVEKFRKKYGQIGSIMDIPTLKYGEIVLPTKKKAGTAKGGKKK